MKRNTLSISLVVSLLVVLLLLFAPAVSRFIADVRSGAASSPPTTKPAPPARMPLVTLSDTTSFRFYNRRDIRAVPLSLIFTSQLGAGRIVTCSFPGFRDLPPSLNRAVGGKFLLRCVKWLAERPTTMPAT